MDKKKIREALELCYRWMEAIYPEKLFPFPAPHDMADGIEARIARQAAKEALAELDAAPDNQYSWALVNSLRLSREQWTSLIRDLLDRGASLPCPEQMTTETGRNNLAPAAWLTVEEVERANNVKDQCIATAWDGLSGKILVDGGSGTMRELLCDAHDVIRYLLNKR